MDRIWLDAPLPSLRVRATGSAIDVEPNEAARRWALAHGVGLGALQDLARAGLARGPACVPALVGSVAVTCTRVDLPDGHLVWVSDAGAGSVATQRATEFLDRALVLAGVSVWRIDLFTRRIFFNAVGFRVMGMSEDANGIDLESMRSSIHPEDRQAVEQAAEEALKSDGVVDVVARYRNPDGSWRTLLTRRVAERDVAGRATGLAGISIDLSRQLAERERAEVLHERTQLIVRAEIGLGIPAEPLFRSAASGCSAACTRRTRRASSAASARPTPGAKKSRRPNSASPTATASHAGCIPGCGAPAAAGDAWPTACTWT